MARQLTDSQQKALDKLQDGKWYSAYELQASLNTLSALKSRNLVESRHELGSYYSPRTGIKFRIKQ